MIEGTKMVLVNLNFWSDFLWRLTHRLDFTGSGFNKRSNWKRANNDFFYKCICFNFHNIFIWCNKHQLIFLSNFSYCLCFECFLQKGFYF